MADQYKTMTLGECARYDHTTKAKERLTGWGIICRDRQALGISRRARINAKGASLYKIHMVETTHTTKCGMPTSTNRPVMTTHDNKKVTCPKCRERM